MAISTHRFHRLAARFLVLPALALILSACPRKDGGSGVSSGSSELSGTYVAKHEGGTMTLEFKGGHKVVVTMQETGAAPDPQEADYMVDGKNVTIQIPGGFPLALVREDKALSGSAMGQILRFEKK